MRHNRFSNPWLFSLVALCFLFDDCCSIPEVLCLHTSEVRPVLPSSGRKSALLVIRYCYRVSLWTNVFDLGQKWLIRWLFVEEKLLTSTRLVPRPLGQKEAFVTALQIVACSSLISCSLQTIWPAIQAHERRVRSLRRCLILGLSLPLEDGELLWRPRGRDQQTAALQKPSEFWRRAKLDEPLHSDRAQGTSAANWRETKTSRNTEGVDVWAVATRCLVTILRRLFKPEVDENDDHGSNCNQLISTRCPI